MFVVGRWLGIDLVRQCQCAVEFHQLLTVIGVVDTGLTQLGRFSGAEGLAVDGKNSTREAPLLGATHPLCHCLHPCLAFPVVLTQPSFLRPPGHLVAFKMDLINLTVLVRLVDTRGKSSFSCRSQGKGSGCGGGGGGGGIARRVVDGDGQVVSSRECGGVESGVLRDGSIHGSLARRRHRRDTADDGAGQRWTSSVPSFIPRRAIRKKKLGHDVHQSFHPPVCACHAIAIRYGAASQHRTDPSRFSSVSHACHERRAPHCQEQSSSLDEACVAWTWPPISSHHQPSTPPRATEPQSQDDPMSHEPLKRSISVSSESGG